MAWNSNVSQDIALARRELEGRLPSRHQLSRGCALRALWDTLFDWALIAGAVALVLQGGSVWVPLALLVVGSRQRALGNLLHEAGHRNLSRCATFNDGMAWLLIGPPLLTDLLQYRAVHARHHARLGDERNDPDFIAAPGRRHHAWLHTWLAVMRRPAVWREALWGQLGDAGVPLRRRAGMALWWAVVIGGLAALDERVALVFTALWLGARVTTFTALSVFRELCDHFGLQPGGVLSFTRDIHTASPLRWLVHPHNDGYHLTHHLLPAVPYHRLRQAHQLMATTPLYRQRAHICDSYCFGQRPVVGSGLPLA